MKRIKGEPIKFKNGKISPSKVHYNGKSGSVRICIAKDGGLKEGEFVYQERLDNGIILIVPESIWKQGE